MCLREFFLKGFFCRRPSASYTFFLEICFLVTSKTRVAKFPFPALLVRPGNWKAQYVIVYSEEGFSFSFWYLFIPILLRSVHGESLLMRLHFENNTFVVSISPRARPCAWHLETLVWFWFYVVVTKERFGAAQTMWINLSQVAQCSEVALFEKTFVILK